MRRSIVLFLLLQLTAAWTSAATPTHADVVYQKADGMELSLDIYQPAEMSAGDSKPVVVFFHGGGWMVGDKHDVGDVSPWLNLGWSVVSVQYRLGGVALAPAAVEDARCATWWVARNAAEYGFDAQRIVLTGYSAGGHLSLITGMLPASVGMDARCPHSMGGKGPDRTNASLPELKVAAIVNWSGITDVNDLIAGNNMRSYAVNWLGALMNREQEAARVSPLNYVRPGLPPILTLHGDLDLIVPYAHATRLHSALDEAGVVNQLYTIAGREHFNYNPQEFADGFKTAVQFLGAQGLLESP
jgi:acetyl esterase/lipase